MLGGASVIISRSLLRLDRVRELNGPRPSDIEDRGDLASAFAAQSNEPALEPMREDRYRP